jgi:hypothetical protein
MSSDFDAVVAGYIGVDLAPAFAAGGSVVPLPQLLRPGERVEVGPLDTTPGGVVPNTGLAMAAFGNRVALLFHRRLHSMPRTSTRATRTSRSRSSAGLTN